MGLADDIKKAIEGKISANKLRETCKEALGKMSDAIVNDAKINLRANGTINNGEILNIYADPVGDDLKTEIVAKANHASFIEFGTKKFAAKYVATLPKEWQVLAASERGKMTGTFEELVVNLTQWVKEKQIAGTYSVKSKRRTGGIIQKAYEDYKLAYAIALRIARNGIRARPFLYPAYVKNRNIFDQELNKVFK